MQLVCQCAYACGYKTNPERLLTAALDRANALERKLRTMTEPAPHTSTNITVNKTVKEMIFRFHPDRNKTGLVKASDVIMELNKLKDSL